MLLESKDLGFNQVAALALAPIFFCEGFDNPAFGIKNDHLRARFSIILDGNGNGIAAHDLEFPIVRL